MGNTDTQKRRLLVMIHTDNSSDQAACSFWLDASQAAATAYTMRLHTTKAWANTSVSFYAVDANTPSSHADYHLNNVTLTHRPAGNSAKTECVDPLVPTSGDASSYQNLILDADFIWGGDGWWTYQGQDVQWVNELPDLQRAEVRRKTGTPPPAVRQSQPGWSGAIPARQRVQLTFELRNTRTSEASRRSGVGIEGPRERRRKGVRGGEAPRINQDASASGGGTFAFCTFWLPPNMPATVLYAMTAYAATEWTAPELVVSPQTAGAQGDNGWIQFDTVTWRKTNRAMLGTECYEPGSFVVDGTGFIVVEGGQVPAPIPVPVPAPEPEAMSVSDSVRGNEAMGQWGNEAMEWANAADVSGPSVSEPARTDPLTVAIGGTSAGTVTSNPAGISCAGSTVTCTGWFAEGASIALTATPDPGLVFVGWAGACTGTAQPCTVTMLGAQSVVAHFASPLQYYHLDVLGSVRMVTDAAGTVIKRHDYFAFGEDTEGPTGDPRRFTGKERDPETDLHYFGARYYRSVWGRFTSVDPVMGPAAAAPQAWNRYVYCLNNPLRFADRNGQWPSDVHESIIRAAFCQLSRGEVDAIVRGSASVDNMLSGQLTMNAYQHGMRAPWEDSLTARGRTDSFIAEHEAKAARDTRVALFSSVSAGYFEFGRALHPVLDRLSRAHAGEQVWFGLDLAVGPLFLFGVGANGWNHVDSEALISPAEFNKAVEEARRHFLKTFGLQKFQKATGCTQVEGCLIRDDDKPWYLRNGGGL